jgi:hypothetical protein
MRLPRDLAWGLVIAALPPVIAARAEAPSEVAVESAHEIGRFATPFTDDAEHRARVGNLRLAAEALDGAMLAPGEVFSFNARVGERVEAFGYAKAPVIRDKVLAEGIGGGTCQVASTLHAAALLAGLGIVERSPHSHASAYIRVGLDATVVFPTIDLKLRNRFGTPVRIRTKVTRGQLEIALLSDAEARPRVTVTTTVLGRTAFARTLVHDETLPRGTKILRQYGLPGLRVARTRDLEQPSGSVRREIVEDRYASADEIIAVGPGFEGGEPPEATAIERGLVKPSRAQLWPSRSVTLGAD